jgi:GTP cyclohydrolase I
MRQTTTAISTTVDTVDPCAAFAAVLNQLGVETTGDLEETPQRWVRAFLEMTSGYTDDPVEILSKRFKQPAADELVILRDIEFTSLCEHHLLPFTGTAHVAYLPGGFLVGLSKLARLVECYARRLQVQERMTHQIATAIMENLDSRAVGVVIKAHHSCMGCRGVRKPGATMITSCLLGMLRTNSPLRAEFLSLVA